MRLAYSMLGLLLAAGVASAQTPPTTTTPPTSTTDQQLSRIDRLAILLDLTDGQKAQLQQILQEQHQQMRAFWQQQQASGAKPDFQQMRQERQALKQQTLAKLQGFLSAGQIQKFELLTSRPRGHRWHQGPPPGESGASSSSAG